jgi:AcrR family transcriptional regulator
MPAAPSQPGKDLDCAEELFMEHGFRSASLRLITSAEPNLAAVNYHFGSKEDLFQAVLTGARPMNRERSHCCSIRTRGGAGALSCEDSCRDVHSRAEARAIPSAAAEFSALLGRYADGALTPTLKLKRPLVLARFKDAVDSAYASDGATANDRSKARH